jgi:hypothetical protein
MKKEGERDEHQGSQSLYRKLACPDTMEEFPRDTTVAVELKRCRSVLEFVVAFSRSKELRELKHKYICTSS